MASASSWVCGTKRILNRRSLGIVVVVSLVACGTTRTTSGGAVGVDRQQSMTVSAAKINRSAEKTYRATLRAAQAKNALNRDQAQLERVRGIANRLIAVSDVFRPDASAWDWEVNVLGSRELNAWCLPGGKMAIYTGLIERLRVTDDELAAVIGHEIAHALREHGREKASQSAGLRMAAAIGGALIGSIVGFDGGVGQSVIGTVGDLAFMRPNSRGMEDEADLVGVELAARAGYDPYAAVTLWEKMGRVSSGQPPEWLSTHPSHESRISDLRTYAERVQPLYAGARKGG